MAGSCFADRLGGWIELTDGERAALARLEERERHLRRGAMLVRENDRISELFVLRQGMMMSYLLLDDGSRQILRFHFPGDMLAMPGLAYRESPETIAALNDCVVAPFDRSLMTDLVVQHPRLAAAMAAIAQMERTMSTDRLAAIGRTSAKARVAALLLELRARLNESYGARVADHKASFAPGLTQEEIGDATGLTAVHVNRMLRQMEEERLIARGNGRVTLLDEGRLRRAASYVDRLEGLDLGWLPPPAERG